jgi:uncharacterized protein YbjT (DUF2867 family)
MLMGLRRVLLGCLLATLAACTTGAEIANRAGTSTDEVILVFGASGRTGQYIIRQLAAEGRIYRAVTSNVERARAKVGENYPWVQADVRDPASLAPLFAGATTVISALGATEFKGPNGPEFVDYEGVRNVVDVARANNIRQVVLISAAGVTVADHPLNRMGGVMTWKLKGEDYLRSSGIAYTILRPGGLKDTEAGTVGVTLLKGDRVPYNDRRSITSRGELAAVAIGALDDPAARFKTVEIFNDSDARPGNWRSLFAGVPADPR